MLLGFISNQSTVVDDFDLTGTSARNTRNKTKAKTKVSKKKRVQKPVFVFNHAIKSSRAYLDYFNPDPDVESLLMGLSDLVCLSFPLWSCLSCKVMQKTSSKSYIDRNNTIVPCAQSRPAHADDDSQTQEETQLAAMANLSFEERRDDDLDHPRKRIKISVTMGVDLAE
jgi:hypothetical protein